MTSIEHWFNSKENSIRYFYETQWWGKEIIYQKYENETESYIKCQIISNYLDFIEINEATSLDCSKFSNQFKANINTALHKLKKEVDSLILKKRPTCGRKYDLCVGICYRSDSGGSAALNHDKRCIDAIQLLRIFRNFSIRIRSEFIGYSVIYDSYENSIRAQMSRNKLLQNDARLLRSKMSEIHLIYIPGGPFANDLEIRQNKPKLNKHAPEIDDFDNGIKNLIEEYCDSIKGSCDEIVSQKLRNLLSNEKYEKNKNKIYKYLESKSRSFFELKVIEIAKEKNIPILAVCAGSWRLYESYCGKNEGKILRFDQDNLAKHYQPGSNTWSLKHGINVTIPENSKKLFKTEGFLYDNTITIPNCNSTHWAHCVIGDIEDLNQIATCLDTNTSEGFKDKNNSKIVGFQFHPESYLPGIELLNDPETVNTVFNENIIKYSNLIFEDMLFSRHTIKKIIDLSQTTYQFKLTQIIFEKLKEKHLLNESIRIKCVNPYYYHSSNISIHNRRYSIAGG